MVFSPANYRHRDCSLRRSVVHDERHLYLKHLFETQEVSSFVFKDRRHLFASTPGRNFCRTTSMLISVTCLKYTVGIFDAVLVCEDKHEASW